MCLQKVSLNDMRGSNNYVRNFFKFNLPFVDLYLTKIIRGTDDISRKVLRTKPSFGTSSNWLLVKVNLIN